MSDTFVWTGKGNSQYWFAPGNWSDTANNSTTSAPGSGQVADFTGGATSVFGDVSVAALNIAANTQVSLGALPGGATYSFGTLTLGAGATLTLQGGTSLTVGTATLGKGADLNISNAWFVGVSIDDPNATTDAATTPAIAPYPGPVSAIAGTLSLAAGASVVLGDRNIGVGTLDDGNSSGGGFSGTGHVVGPTTAGTGTGGSVTDSACFVAGTRIATATGERPVETLRPGDLVCTATGRHASVVWVGLRTVAGATPVCIAAGAIAPGVPRTDLLLSPDHAVFLDGVLIPARLLRNGATVRAAPATAPVTYVHVELDRHDLLVAEGLASESYLDTGNRVQFDRSFGPARAVPAAAVEDGDRLAATRAVYAAQGCATLVLGGDAVARLHRRLTLRARALGWRLARHAAPVVRVGGRTLPGRSEPDGTLVFALPPGTQAVDLASRSFVPHEIDPMRPDGRRLGVAASLRLNDAALEEAAFGAGWYAPDPGCDWRWTDGAGRLHLRAPVRPARLLVRVMPTGACYWRAPTRSPAAG
jgi:hypothetical protein